MKIQFKETTTLDDLVGKHKLSGVDYNREVLTNLYDCVEECEVVNFILDGVTYTAVEDPENDYRSCMAEIGITDYEVKNTFEPVDVIARKRPPEPPYFYDNDILEFIIPATGLMVLAVGTQDVSDYYPMWVAKWIPENLPQGDL